MLGRMGGGEKRGCWEAIWIFVGFLMGFFISRIHKIDSDASPIIVFVFFI